MIANDNTQWSVVDAETWVHLLPDSDIAYHRLTVFCACRPEPQAFQRGYKRGLVHNAFDVREVFGVKDCIEPFSSELPVGYDAVFFSSLQQ